MKKKMSDIVEKNSDILLAKTEQALLEKLPVDQKTLRRLGKLIEPKNLRLAALGAIGTSVLITVVTNIGHDRLYRAAVAREMKKQLEPLRKKLDALEAQNAVLWQQNEELKAQMILIEKRG